jgi:pSer/pThr/pTyr-binding forkhead associated (FHA) protein
VQFQPAAQDGARVKAEGDDTKEIVSPKAVQYLANRKTVMASRLVLVTSEGDTSFPLTRDAYTIGRHRNNDIVISDPKVSSFHARIDRSAEGFVLVDLKSRNGSYINGKRIETGLLKTGDEVRMGTARLVYKVDYSAPVS